MSRNIPPPWQAQLDAVDFLRERGEKGAMLFMACGTGKSRCLVMRLEELIATHAVRRILVISTIASLYAWPVNWGDFAKKPVAFIDLHKHREPGLQQLVKLSKQGAPVIGLVNYASAKLIGRKRMKKTRNGQTTNELMPVGLCLDDVNWDVVIIDEGHKLKTPSSAICKFVRTKLLWKGGEPKVKHRFLLTGSAFTKRPLDVWGPTKAITGDEIFPGPLQEFKARFTIPDPVIFGRILAYTNLETFAKRLRRAAILLKKEDVVELPPFFHVVKLIPLCDKARKIYDELTAEGYAALEPADKKLYDAYQRGEVSLEEVTASHVFALISKQRQICGGYIVPDGEVNEEGELVRGKPRIICTNKVEAVMDFLEMRDGEPTPIVLQFDFEEVILKQQLKKVFDFVPKVLNGKVKGTEQRHTMIANAANDMSFLLKESVGGEGIDMRWADTLVHYSHSSHTDTYEQVLSRNHRGGVKHESITYMHFLYENTEDERMYKNLNRDLKQAEKIEEYWKSK